MKSHWCLVLALLIGIPVVLGQDDAAKKKATDSSDQIPPPRTTKERASYAIGMNIGKSLKKERIDVDLKLVAQGLKDALAGAKPLCSEAEMQEAMSAVQKEAQASQGARNKELAVMNTKEGEAFLAENKTKDGVTTTKSGLQYKVIKSGTGKMPKASDTVVTHYRGTLIDGTVFDSSYDRGVPATFPVGRVIKGWTEALQLMPVGSKWKLFIPSNLAYGEEGFPPDIGPNAMLIFDIELLSIK
jgi:FKBP-type peptidyl-prolyl cis-trans isomerase FklB